MTPTSQVTGPSAAVDVAAVGGGSRIVLRPREAVGGANLWR